MNSRDGQFARAYDSGNISYRNGKAADRSGDEADRSDGDFTCSDDESETDFATAAIRDDAAAVTLSGRSKRTRSSVANDILARLSNVGLHADGEDNGSTSSEGSGDESVDFLDQESDLDDDLSLPEWEDPSLQSEAELEPEELPNSS